MPNVPLWERAVQSDGKAGIALMRSSDDEDTIFKNFEHLVKAGPSKQDVEQAKKDAQAYEVEGKYKEAGDEYEKIAGWYKDAKQPYVSATFFLLTYAAYGKIDQKILTQEEQNAIKEKIETTYLNAKALFHFGNTWGGLADQIVTLLNKHNNNTLKIPGDKTAIKDLASKFTKYTDAMPENVNVTIQISDGNKKTDSIPLQQIINELQRLNKQLFATQ